MTVKKEFKQFLRGLRWFLPILLGATMFAIGVALFPWVGIALCVLGILFGIYKIGEDDS